MNVSASAILYFHTVLAGKSEAVCADFEPNGPATLLNIFELLLFDTAIENGVLNADKATPLVVLHDVVIRRRRR
ncbi:hypothetical protein Y032_0376g250 [Ancylostoma ceylanicum]|uniref:Uncharacterized protein n=1 Tax=Ancylostoma ceylanicum TaxID=53326 RepID=A0A016RUA2_9BILA|nr:hypothetical protein Y032_0376g250 [Ancylostoma ceylanicum]